MKGGVSKVTDTPSFHLKESLFKGYSKPWNNLSQALEQSVPSLGTSDRRHYSLSLKQVFKILSFKNTQIYLAFYSLICIFAPDLNSPKG